MQGAQGFDYPDNYTAATFPAQWNTSSTAACTPRGIELSQKFAQSLSARLTAPVSILADNVTRNLQTAQAVRQGLGSSAGEVQPDGALFNPVSNKVCADLSTEEYNGQIKGQLASVADPKSPLHSEWSQHQVKLAELQTLVGTGVAPALEHIPTNVSGGYLTGGLYVASEGLIETFMLEAGSGLSVAWGSLDGSNRSALYHNWLELHGLYAHLNHGGVKIGARNGGAVLWHTLEELDSTDGGSSVLVGHDLTLDGIGSLLGISWGCGPFSESATPPMSGLLFSRTSAGNVAIQAVSICSDFTERCVRCVCVCAGVREI